MPLPDDLTNRPETENGAPPDTGGFWGTAPILGGSQAQQLLHRRYPGRLMGLGWLKRRSGGNSRVGRGEAEAIAATRRQYLILQHLLSGGTGRCFGSFDDKPTGEIGLATGLGRC